MKTQLSVEIDRPIEEVFQYIHEHTLDWIESVVSDDVIREQNGGGFGTTFRMVTQERGQRMEFEGEVTSWNPPRSSSCYLKGDAFDVDVAYELRSLNSGATVVTQNSVVYPRGSFTKIVFFLCGWAMKGAGKRSLEKDFARLKSQLEARN